VVQRSGLIADLDPLLPHRFGFSSYGDAAVIFALRHRCRAKIEFRDVRSDRIETALGPPRCQPTYVQLNGDNTGNANDRSS